MKTRRNLSFVLAIAMIFQAFLVFPGAAFAEDTGSADAEEETLYTLTFIVNGKIAQRRYAHAGEALGFLPEIEAPDGAVLSHWHCGEEAVNAETIATSDMVLTAF